MTDRDFTIRFAKVEDVPAICEAFREMSYSRPRQFLHCMI